MLLEDLKHTLSYDGYAIVNYRYFRDYGTGFSCGEDEALVQLQDSYDLLPVDPYSSARYRTYTRFLVTSPNPLHVESCENASYIQSYAANDIDGARERKFPPITAAALSNKLLVGLLKADAEIMSDYFGLTSFYIGIHQVRYKTSIRSPSFSSPIWLHRDDEALVFVHLINTSPGLVGGTNVIARDQKTLVDVVELTNPLDTLILTRNLLHCVTPMGCKNAYNQASRDIFLVTFEERKCIVT